jgi:hypothetical protein
MQVRAVASPTISPFLADRRIPSLGEMRLSLHSVVSLDRKSMEIPGAANIATNTFHVQPYVP